MAGRRDEPFYGIESLGYFAKAPKCKGKRNASPKLLEQLSATGAT